MIVTFLTSMSNANFHKCIVSFSLAIRKKLQEKVGVVDISLTYSMNCEHSTEKGGLWKKSVYDHPSKIFVVQSSRWDMREMMASV